MLNRRRLLPLVLFSAPLLVVGAACTFPDTMFDTSTIEAGAGAETSTGDTGNTTDPEGGTTFEAGSDAPFEGSVVMRKDGEAVIEAGTCPPTNCDCDKDGYQDPKCDAGPGSTLKPGDCDDLDPVRHPDQGFVSDPPPAGRDGNWNCVNGVEPQYPAVMCTGSGAGGCKGAGLAQVTACGMKADFVNCVGSGLGGLGTCMQQPGVTGVTQACK